MKRLLYVLCALAVLAACDEKEVGPTFYYYVSAVEIVDADGGNVIANYTDGETIWDCSVGYDEATLGKGLHWSVMNENGSVSIQTLSGGPIPLVDNTAELSLRSRTLFSDDSAHTLRLRYEKRSKYLYEAAALTFDGQEIEPGEDGVFVIRLAQ